MQSYRGGPSTTKGPSSTQHAFYRPLDSAVHEIRLVQLHPGQSCDPVSATLVYSTLTVPDRARHAGDDTSSPAQSAHSYEAISYTWDEVPRKSPMCLNGYEVFQPASAVEVLRVFRHATSPRSLWIDAICINQEDLDERASQVAFMGDIYEAGAGTLVWLGDEDDDTVSALHACRSIGQHTAKPSNTRTLDIHADDGVRISAADKAKLLAIYNRRWFSRAWVLQEAALSRSCICYLGSLTITWQQLMLAAFWLVSGEGYGTILEGSFSDAVMTATRVAILVRFGKVGKEVQKTPNLGHLLAVTSSLHSSDPRDKVYALLSLSIWRASEHQRLIRLQPDYRISFRHCAGHAVRCAIFEEQLDSIPKAAILDILSSLILETDDHVDTDPEPWPSWIRCAPKIRHLDDQGRFDSDDYSAGTILYQGELVDVIESGPVQDTNVLSLRGVTVDHVSDVVYYASVSAFGDVLEGVRDQFESFQEMMAFLAGDRDDDKSIAADYNRFVEINEDTFTKSDEKDRQTRKVRALKLWERMRGNVEGRKIFRTTGGHMGIGPVGTGEDDRIVVLFGGKLPFVIGDRGYGDVLVGPCIVRGFMQGEALRDPEAACIQSQVFDLH